MVETGQRQPALRRPVRRSHLNPCSPNPAPTRFHGASAAARPVGSKLGTALFPGVAVPPPKRQQ
jgi:hypothetical protein